MKCSQCGNEKLVKTNLPMESYGDGGSWISGDVDIYLCLKCGHYEFFSMKKVHDYEETVSYIKEKEKELNTLKLKLVKMESDERKNFINKRIPEITEKLKSIDITIRQQQKLQGELDELKTELSRLPQEISYLKNDIRQIESELESKKYNFEQGSF